MQRSTRLSYWPPPLTGGSRGGEPSKNRQEFWSGGGEYPLKFDFRGGEGGANPLEFSFRGGGGASPLKFLFRGGPTAQNHGYWCFLPAISPIFLRSRLRRSRSPWNSFVGGAREKQTLSEKTLLAHFECARCIEVELVHRRERQNIDIHMQRKNTTVVKILPSTSMACFFCPHVKTLSVPEGIHVQLLKPSSQLC